MRCFIHKNKPSSFKEETWKAEDQKVLKEQ
jgi:hypothetical protein